LKKKLFLLVLLVAVVASVLYFYAYKDHRDIATETADFTITVSSLNGSDSLTYKKYTDKTIQVSGKLTSIDAVNKAIVIDEKLFAVFLEEVPSNLSVGKQIKIKGRFLDYDDLVEEFKMDQTIVVE
jgi:hypothetical protein